MKKQIVSYKKGDNIAENIIKSGPFNGYYNLIDSIGKVITLSEKEVNELASNTDEKTEK